MALVVATVSCIFCVWYGVVVSGVCFGGKEL
jgi:hypothetical protein